MNNADYKAHHSMQAQTSWIKYQKPTIKVYNMWVL